MTQKKPRKQRLLDALALIGEQRRARSHTSDIIRRLVDEHGASYRDTAHTNTLRLAGTAASCTWSRDTGLLDAWVRLANQHLAVLDGRADPARERVA